MVQSRGINPHGGVQVSGLTKLLEGQKEASQGAGARKENRRETWCPGAQGGGVPCSVGSHAILDMHHACFWGRRVPGGWKHSLAQDQQPIVLRCGCRGAAPEARLCFPHD